MLAEGISSAGDAIAQGVAQWGRNAAESASLDRHAATIARLLAPAAARGNVDKQLLDELASFPAMSLGKKRGALSGFLFALEQIQKGEQEAAQTKRHDEQVGLQRAGLELERGRLMASQATEARRAESEARKTTEDTARQRDTIGMLLGLSGQSELPAPVDPERPGPFLQQEFPNADAAVIERLLREGGGGRNRLPELMNLGGREVVANRHTGAFQVLPESLDAERIQAVPIHDDQGKVVAHGIPTGRGGIQIVRVAPEHPPDGTPVPGLEKTHVYVGGKQVKKEVSLLGNDEPGATPEPPKARVYNPKTKRLE